MQKSSRVFIAVSILLLFYVSGLIGISVPSVRNWFLSLTPLNLLLTASLFIWANKDLRRGFLAVCALIYVSCFFVEVAGVHTRAIFGDYAYGQALGAKWLEVPLIIGANWLLLVLCTAGMVQPLKVPALLKWVLGATLMVALDWLIEPIAMRLDFWNWNQGIVPVQNYVAWWGVSFVMQVLLHLTKPRLDGDLSTSVFLLQVFFFSGLHISFATGSALPELKFLYVLLLVFSLGYPLVKNFGHRFQLFNK